ncbi:acetyltransferase (GNAT) family protein [Gibbsiella quercinecans]|uniref:GCN5 family acetyltransferase n=2 Tax=Gibbsiella TaxID=929812 RepID=A0A250AYW5_9GAMM|nr:GNAT family N-acetyltransferase [Gibbsiella quercinecans]ATA19051.1 GCN5 family acetyltransferase [Gibbsiella quercinecans]RLM03627.1 GNAT family N-acetyltransferase [Gibbsiella quercinecans]RLM07713.1 GNAT family N-acetyltransferase [Gibbsiella quercinecans]TCT82000.1 acetyltransferase (GNAT) family protein [Gibbsiella quercinecans]
MPQRIVPLADVPQFIDVCAAWAFEQWGSQHGGTLEQARQRFRLCARQSADHATLLMVAGPTPLAMASLWPSDDHHRMPLSPWLTGLFVHPDYRRQGIAQRLTQAIERLARQRHYPALYLKTDSAEMLYARWGWQAIERRTQPGGNVVIMVKRL